MASSPRRLKNLGTTLVVSMHILFQGLEILRARCFLSVDSILLPGIPGTVTLTIANSAMAAGRHHAEQILQRSVQTATLAVINSTCANPKALWMKEMDSVTWPDDTQLAKLRAASAMCEEQVDVVRTGTDAVVTIKLEPYAAAMLTIG